MAKNRQNRPPQVTEEQIAAMANTTGVSDVNVDQTVAERSGSDDKVAAATAETALAKVKTLTPEGGDWINRDPYGLKTDALYGQRGRFALRYEDLTRRAQFLGRPLDVADLEEIHGPDETAPATAPCTVCGEQVTSFVRTAMINNEGDLMRDHQDGDVTYRGQFVVTGKPMSVHAAHVGDCLYKLRNARGKRKDIQVNGKTRSVADLLPSQSSQQASVRLAGIQGHFSAKDAEKQAFQERLGFKVGDAVRNGGRRDESGIDRGSFAPKTPRGQRRNERRWTENEGA